MHNRLLLISKLDKLDFIKFQEFNPLVLKFETKVLKHYYSSYKRYFRILIFGINRRKILLFKNNKINRIYSIFFQIFKLEKFRKKQFFSIF